MYLYTTVEVSGYIFVYYGSTERTCICILRFKRAVIYLYSMVKVSGDVLYTTVQVRGRVFVYNGSSERSCIFILRFK
jgi:hypothetical protein